MKIVSLLSEKYQRENLKKSISVLHFFWRTVLKQKNKGLGLMLSQQRLPQNCATMKSLADSCLLCWIPSTNKMNGIIGNTKLKLYTVQTYYVLLELILLSIGRWLTGQVARYCLALLSIIFLYLKKKVNRQMTSGVRYPGFLIEWIFCWIE